MKFELYHSESEQAYTLLETGTVAPGQLEDDAVLILQISAKDWDDAVAQEEQFLYKG